MAEADRRSVLVEIPEPQDKTTGCLRRSYMEILCSRLSSGKHTCSHQRRSRERPHACQTSNQLLDTLLLAEQSVERASGALTSDLLTSDLPLLLRDLLQRKAGVFRSIPYSRLGSNRDARCYRKARPHLLAFQRSCEEAGHVLLRSGQWEKLLAFVQTACRVTSELPQWDTSGHNTLREHVYNTLAALCTAALKKHQPSGHRARGLLRRFRAAPGSRRAVEVCVEQLEKITQEHNTLRSCDSRDPECLAMASVDRLIT